LLSSTIGGGLLLLVYALYRRDPVFIAGEASGVLSTAAMSCATDAE
jgi:lipid-A-disaccharide synthase-like uncharacterized protein